MSLLSVAIDISETTNCYDVTNYDFELPKKEFLTENTKHNLLEGLASSNLAKVVIIKNVN